MAVGLFRYIEVIKDDKLFKALFGGTLFLVVSQIISAYHSFYSNINPSVWVPELQAYVISFELAAYVLIFGSIQEYFRRFADNI